jgi:hypothetical protein
MNEKEASMQQTKTITVGSCTVVIHRPELTGETRRQREGELQKALARYALHTAEQERRTNT